MGEITLTQEPQRSPVFQSIIEKTYPTVGRKIGLSSGSHILVVMPFNNPTEDAKSPKEYAGLVVAGEDVWHFYIDKKPEWLLEQDNPATWETFINAMRYEEKEDKLRHNEGGRTPFTFPHPFIANQFVDGEGERIPKDTDGNFPADLKDYLDAAKLAKERVVPKSPSPFKTVRAMS